ncbi:Spo0E family sporulation regulatory protein-aspartic acid phosphatase [Clostridium lundense]|nr:Spo0E family sporulation regulatory protein-aspartic acid phosphatase [Clostridium lundense]
MNELQGLLKDIEILRDKLQKMINQKHGDLVDSDVVAVSKLLNAMNIY